jgi:hypothetical protein
VINRSSAYEKYKTKKKGVLEAGTPGPPEETETNLVV